MLKFSFTCDICANGHLKMHKFYLHVISVLIDLLRMVISTIILQYFLKNSARNQRIMRNSDEFDIPISRFTSISRFPQFDYQRLWNVI